MKRKIFKTAVLTIIILFSTICINAQIKKEYHKNGNIKSIGNYTNGEKNGEWKTYFESGNIESLVNYHNGKENGECKYYYDNGNLKSVFDAQDGVYIGISKSYFENGKLEAEYDFTIAEYDIGLKTYYENGNLNSTCFYSSNITLPDNYLGTEHKSVMLIFWAEWCKPCIDWIKECNLNYEKWSNETGLMIYLVYYGEKKSTETNKIEDFLISKGLVFEVLYDYDSFLRRFFEINTIPYTIIYSGITKNVISQTDTYVNKDGELFELLTDIKNEKITTCINCKIKLNGEYKQYYESGKIKTSGVMLNGEKQGQWTEYNEDGTIIKTVIFKTNWEQYFDAKKKEQQEAEDARKKEQQMAEYEKQQKEEILNKKKQEFTGVMTDPRDGKTYKTVFIEEQIWMAENLNYNTGNSWCYDNSFVNCNIYGRLYDWETAKKVCPTGWHLPSNTEWTQLTDYLGGNAVAGGKLKEAGTTHWESPNTEATNETGFTALPGGYRYGNGAFGSVGSSGYWWSATEGSTDIAWARRMRYNYSGVGSYGYYKELGFSVRCLRD